MKCCAACGRWDDDIEDKGDWFQVIEKRQYSRTNLCPRCGNVLLKTIENTRRKIEQRASEEAL